MVPRMEMAMILRKLANQCDVYDSCESGCAYNGITDFVTDMLMKVQQVAVSENSDHDSCVSLTMVWTWNFLLSRQT